MALGIAPKEALLNDYNWKLIAFWTAIAMDQELLSVGSNEKESYLEARSEFNRLARFWTTTNIRTIASYFYYLNRTCFNGLYRENSKGEFNVPMGSYKTINYRTRFPDVTELIKNWSFSSSDFESLGKFHKSDFLYVDPPYDDNFSDFTARGFSFADQERLAVWLSKHRHATVVVSNSNTPRIVKLYKSLGFTVSKTQAPRRISCSGDRQDATEMLATKNLR